MSLYHAYSQTVADGTATSVVRPSDWNSAHNQNIALAGNTTGQSFVSGTDIAFQGGNNVTLSAITAIGAATILISGANTFAQSVQPVYYAASGSTSNSNTLPFGNTNGVSFSLSNGSVVATVATDYMASNQSSNFVNTSQSSLFQQTSATSAITSNAFPTANSTNLVNTSQSSLFQQTSATSAITSNAFPSANTTKFAGTGTTFAGTNVTATLNLNSNGLGLSLSGAAAGTAGANVAFSASGGSSAFTTLTFSNQANGVTFVNSAGQVAFSHSLQELSNTSAITSAAFPSANTTKFAGTGFTSTTTAGTAVTAALGTNGLTMAVPNYLTTYAAQTVQPVAFSASGGSSAFSTLTFSNQANNVSFINSAGQIALSHSLQPLSNTTQFAGTGTTLALTNLSGTLSQNSNGIALSLNNVDANIIGWELEGANTAGTTVSTMTTNAPLYFQGGNNVTLSGNSNTIIISAAAAAWVEGTISYYDLYELGNNTVLTSYGQNSLHFQLFEPGLNITMTGINMLASMSSSTSAASVVCGLTMSYGIYSQGTGTNSTRLESMATSSFFINAFASSTTTASYAVGQLGSSFATNSGGTVVNSVLSGMKALQLPFVTSLASSGHYACVFANSTSSVGNTNALRLSHVAMTAMSGVSGSFGFINTGGVLASNSSLTQEFQQLVWSTTSNAWPATIAYNALSNNGASVNHAFAYFNA